MEATIAAGHGPVVVATDDEGLSIRVSGRDLHWRCSCGQERIEVLLLQLGRDELARMLAEDGRAEVVCHFCNIPYQVGRERLAELIALHDAPAS